MDKDQKYIGQIQWFGTTDGAKYGFAYFKNDIKASVFFHKNTIVVEQQDCLSEFTKSKFVTARIRKSAKNNDKLEAFDVSLLNKETDWDFLFDTYVSRNSTVVNEYSLYRELFDILEGREAQQFTKYLIAYVKNNYELNIFTIIQLEKQFGTQLFLKEAFRSWMLENIEINETVDIEDVKNLDTLFELQNEECLKNFKHSILERVIYKSVNIVDIKKIVFNLGFSDELKLLAAKTLLNLADGEHVTRFDAHEIQKLMLFFNEANETKLAERVFELSSQASKVQLWLNDDKELSNFIVNSKPEPFDEYLINYIKNNYELNISTIIQLEKHFGLKLFLKDEFRNWMLENLELTEIVDIDKIKSLNSLFRFSYKKCLDDFKNSILDRIIYNFDNIADIKEIVFDSWVSDELKLSAAKALLRFDDGARITNLNAKEIQKILFIFNENDCEDLIEKLILLTSPVIKIELWLNNDLQEIDNEWLKNVKNLDSENQVKFIKKLFNYIHLNKIQMNLDEILQIDVTDYSSKVVLELLRLLNQRVRINQYQLRYSLLEILSDPSLFKKADDVLQLQHYFNKCNGRAFEQSEKFNNEVDYSVCKPANSHSNSEFIGWGKVVGDRIYSYFRSDSLVYIQNLKPMQINIRDRVFKTQNSRSRQIKICDGTLAKKLSDGGAHFWWCNNDVCFQHARIPNPNKNWIDYNLLDFLAILQMPIYDDEIATLYGVINHVNRFLEHMNCTSCGHLLKPKGKSLYAFYRVTRFDCRNPECEKPDLDVYISHCSNSRCSSVIDDRYSEKCSNGWVICNSCLACCSKEHLEKRNLNLRIVRASTKNVTADNDDILGHRGRKILCPRCTNPLHVSALIHHQADRELVLADFQRLASLTIPTDEKLVGKNGTNKAGDRWFVIYRRHLDKDYFLGMLKYWQSIGLYIPDLEQSQDKSNYLVVSPNVQSSKRISNLQCKHCGYEYKFGNDMLRNKAIEYWHYDVIKLFDV